MLRPWFPLCRALVRSYLCKLYAKLTVTLFIMGITLIIACVFPAIALAMETESSESVGLYLPDMAPVALDVSSRYAPSAVFTDTLTAMPRLPERQLPIKIQAQDLYLDKGVNVPGMTALYTLYTKYPLLRVEIIKYIITYQISMVFYELQDPAPNALRYGSFQNLTVIILIFNLISYEVVRNEWNVENLSNVLYVVDTLNTFMLSIYDGQIPLNGHVVVAGLADNNCVHINMRKIIIVAHRLYSLAAGGLLYNPYLISTVGVDVRPFFSS